METDKPTTLQEAQQHLREGRPEKAIELLVPHIKRNPRDLRALTVLEEAYAANGNTAMAQAVAQQATTIEGMPAQVKPNTRKKPEFNDKPEPNSSGSAHTRRCEKCGYVMEPLDKECKRCQLQRNGAGTTVKPRTDSTTAVNDSHWVPILGVSPRAVGYAAGATLLLVVIAIVVSIQTAPKGASSTAPQYTAPQYTAPPSKDNSSMAWVMAQDFVKDRLKSPGTASFGKWYEQVYSDRVTALGNNRYLVRGWVDAQNAFGATCRTDFVCLLQEDTGDTWRLLDISMQQRE